MYLFLANTVLVLHFAFILFVIFGGVLILYRKWAILLHLPAVFWGVWIEYSGRICPLTPIENHFRILSGQNGYDTGFIHYYLMWLIYPDGLTREIQICLGTGVLVLNIILYSWIYFRLIKRINP